MVSAYSGNAFSENSKLPDQPLPIASFYKKLDVPKETPKKNICTDCGKSFVKYSKLKLHVNSVHLKLKPYNCNICGESFAQSGNLNKHIQIVHEKKKPYSCPDCPESFSVKLNLIEHVQRVHEKKIHKCNLCNAQFTL